MKPINKIGLILGMFVFCSLSAQVDRQTKTVNSESDKEIISETTEKIYNIVINDKVISNSVKINTVKQQEMKLKKDDAGIVNRDRKFPKEEIIKTVKIDNDVDDDFDEQIRFRYKAHSSSDFVMVTNGDEILIGLEDGENLRILEAWSTTIDDVQNGKESFIITDENGAEVEFIIDEYKALSKPEDM